MLRVGLTGGLGSGKTTVAHLFAALGVHVIQADEVGRALMRPGQAVYSEIVQRFGAGVVREDGLLDRRALADLAFRDGRLQELNRIVHPPVIAAQEEWMRGIFSSDPKAIAMVESALLFEASGEAGREGTVPGWRQRFDSIVLVTAPDEVKIARYVERICGAGRGGAGRGGAAEQENVRSAEEQARIRLAAQIPDRLKAALSNYIIDNGGSLQATERAVNDVYLKLRAEADEKQLSQSN